MESLPDEIETSTKPPFLGIDFKTPTPAWKRLLNLVIAPFRYLFFGKVGF